MSFLDLVLDSTKEYEAPRRFYYWAALSSVSAILKDRVWFDMGKAYNLYPNIYVLLYGPSGVRKGPAIALAEKIVSLVDNTRIINGRASIEAIIKELGTFTTREKREPLRDSCGFVVASELSSSIISNPAAMDIMTNLFDRIYNEGEWRYKLKVGESHILNKPTITWLSGTNEALFKEFLPEKNIYGGLIGRMFMISEREASTINSLMFDPEIIPDYKKMAELIRPASKLVGQFKMEKELRIEVDLWYKKFKKEVSPGLNDETGFVSRILDFLIKTSMLISTARRLDHQILKEDFLESLEVIMPLIVPTKRVVQILNKSDPSGAEKRGIILTYIANRPNFSCSRKEILRNLSLRIDHEDLDKTINLLTQINAIKLSSIGGGEILYSLNMENEKVRNWVEQYRR